MLHAEGKKRRDPFLISQLLVHDKSSLLGLAIRSLPILLSMLVGSGLIFLAHGTPFLFAAGVGAFGLIVLVTFLSLKFG